MSEEWLRKDRDQFLKGFETGRPGDGTARKQPRRVSRRRELAVVTLGAVAAFSGLGGFLPLGLAHGLLPGSGTGSPCVLAFYAATLLVVAYALFRGAPRSGPLLPHRGRRKWIAKDLSEPPDTATKENGHVVR